jgi:hypothetical protein|tara:strand:- start:1373 stop:1819 length:447 start_codon:yes stop_codon:yes gene_type:complete
MKAIEIQSPNKIVVPEGYSSMFLAGSIEMGIAEDWQKRVQKQLLDKEIVFLNPRRDDWDASWEQTIENPKFKEQVEWELNGLDQADVIFMYFDPATKSPISLLELGLHANSSKMMVCCPEGFWRKGNVDIICERYGITQFDSLNEIYL